MCEVGPEVYRKIAGKRIYIGMSICRVVEYVDVVQCKGCQGFGHMEAKCRRGRVICAHCVGVGHGVKDCEKREASDAEVLQLRAGV